MRHTTVADVMSTNVISANAQDSFARLAAMLRNAAIRAVPVVDDDGKLKGVVSEADLMAAVAHPEGGDDRRWWRPRHIRRRSPQAKAGRYDGRRAHDHRRRDGDPGDAAARGRPHDDGPPAQLDAGVRRSRSCRRGAGPVGRADGLPARRRIDPG
jgi:hypothetical protein